MGLVISYSPEYQVFVTITERFYPATALAVMGLHCNMRNLRDKTGLAHLYVFARHRPILTWSSGKLERIDTRDLAGEVKIGAGIRRERWGDDGLCSSLLACPCLLQHV